MMRIGKFTDFYRDVTKAGTKIPQEKYLKVGHYPVIDQGRQAIVGRWDSDDGICKEIPAIIFGDHTRAIKYIEEPFFIGADGVKILRPVNVQDNPKYLYYALQAARIPNLGYSRHFKALKELDFHVCSIEKQDEIVRILEKIDYLIEQCHEEDSCLNQIVKSRFIELFGDPKDNPKGYSKKQLKETCRVITGNTPSRAVSEYYGDHIEWIKTDNIVSGLLNPTTATESLSEKGMAVSRTVESGAILMACIAGSIASIGRVCVTDRKVAFNQQINAIVPSDYNILFLYVMLQISKEYLVDEINMALKGILSKSKLEEKTFYVPPMELQEQFAAFVTQVDKSKLAVQQGLQELETLKKSLMQQYFG